MFGDTIDVIVRMSQSFEGEGGERQKENTAVLIGAIIDIVGCMPEKVS